MVATHTGSMVVAEEIQHVETNGTIGFTGVYEPMGKPDPTPPITEVTKPSGRLPQTDEIGHSLYIWLGIFFISLSYQMWKNKQKQN